MHVLERLRIGVGADEIHSFHIAAKHVLNGVTATATDAHYFNDGGLRYVFHEFKHDISPLLSALEPTKVGMR